MYCQNGRKPSVASPSQGRDRVRSPARDRPNRPSWLRWARRMSAISTRLAISGRGESATPGCLHAVPAALWRPSPCTAAADVPGSDDKGHADDDLAVIGPEGSPPSAGISLD